MTGNHKVKFEASELCRRHVKFSAVYSGVYSGEQSYESGLGHDREKNLAFIVGTGIS